MKFKRIMIVSMILLAIFAIGAVSAADENVTSNTLALKMKLLIRLVKRRCCLIHNRILYVKMKALMSLSSL